MIIIQLPNTVPTPDWNGLVIRDNATLITIPSNNLNDVCYCKYECDYVEKVFASDTSNDFWKNDKTSFLFKKLVSADTIAFELWNLTKKLSDITDDTYGTLYSSFTNQPLYKGLIIDWKTVRDVEDFGTYQIKIQQNILGVESTWESHYFQLMPYDDYFANGTIRIETYQEGNIMSSEFDYTNLVSGGWYQSRRINGKFGNKTPKLIIDNYLSNSYELKQIQDKITPEYSLETGLLPSFISNELIYNSLLANKILITDYNIMNTEIFRRVELYPAEISETKNFAFNRNNIFNIKFNGKKDNIIKTNY